MKWTKITPSFQPEENFEGFYWVQFDSSRMQAGYVVSAVYKNGMWHNTFHIDGSVVGQPVDEHGDDTAVAYIQVTKPQTV